MSEPIAIVGMGCRFPGSRDLPGFWETSREGRAWFGEIPADRWKVGAFYAENARSANRTYSRRFGRIEGIRSFAPELYGVSPARARQMDPQQRLFLDVARGALEDAGYARRGPSPGRTGVFLGISTCEYRDYLTARLRLMQMQEGDFGRPGPRDAETLERLVEHVPLVQPSMLPGQMLSMAAANVGRAFDFRGPNFAVDAACSSALVALNEAVLHLRARSCDVAIAGGVYLNLTPDILVCFSRIGALSRSGACRPFDLRADGFVLGEGAGAVVLRRLDDALRDGDSIWAVVRGVGVSSNGADAGPLTPSREGQAAALRAAYADGGVSPETVGFVEAHGTGTPVGDRVEASALLEVFQGNGIDCRLGSVKANIGHTLAAAGVASLIRATLALAYRLAPPQAQFERVSGRLGLGGSRFRVLAAAEPWTRRKGAPCRAGVSSFGFGGTNVHAVLEEAPAAGARRLAAPSDDQSSTEPRRPERFVVGAPTAKLLQLHLRDLMEALGRKPRAPVRDIAYTLSKRSLAEVSVAFEAASHREMLSRLEVADAMLRDSRASDPNVALVESPGRDTAAGAEKLENRDARLCPLPPSPVRTSHYWALREPAEAESRKWTADPLEGSKGNGTHNAALTAASPGLDRRQVRDQLIELVATVLAAPAAGLTGSTHLVSDLGFDSLMVTELAVDIEKSFPGLGPPPESVLSGDPTLDELADLASARLGCVTPLAPPSEAYVTPLTPDDPRVNQHRIGGVPVLRLAAALGVAVDAADRLGLKPNGATQVLRVTDFDVLNAVRLDGGPGYLFVSTSPKPANGRLDSIQAEIGFAERREGPPLPCYRCRLGLSSSAIEPLAPPPRGDRPALTLEEFYNSHMFHGPDLRAVQAVTELGERHVEGWVRTARAGSPADGRVDLLAFDGAFQLCAFWARVRLGKAAMPAGFSELRLLAEIPRDATLRCVAVLEEIAGDRFSGHLDLLDADGRALVQIRGARATAQRMAGAARGGGVRGARRLRELS